MRRFIKKEILKVRGMDLIFSEPAGRLPVQPQVGFAAGFSPVLQAVTLQSRVSLPQGHFLPNFSC